jgi:XTP/dITP diphosphohydrolase
MPLNNQVVIATRNQGKVKEFAAIFQAKHIEVKSLADFKDLPEIIENGDTFAENALIKARTIALALNMPVLGDDSGLCVDKLGGAPGVFSARYAGPAATDEDNNRKLLEQLGARDSQSKDAPRIALSPARFVCAICLVDSDGETIAAVEETCEGEIVAPPRGTGGFGYDPLFYIPELGKTMAELTVAEKNEYSHRGKAIRALWARLK